MPTQSKNNNPRPFTLNEDYFVDSLQNILTKHFLSLSNEIGDNLFVYEILYQNIFEILNTSKSKPGNLDQLAERIDHVFNEQKIHLYKNLKKVISSFCADLLTQTEIDKNPANL